MKLTELGSRATARLPVVILAALSAWVATGCSSSNGTTGVTSGTNGTTSGVASTTSGSPTTTATTTSGATATATATNGTTSATTGGTTATTGTGTATTGTGSTTGSTSGAAATVVASGLYGTGIPSGIGISGDTTTLYVAALDPATGTDAVASVTIATGAVSYGLTGYVGDGGFGPGLVEPAGLQGFGGFYTYVDGFHDVYVVTESGAAASAFSPPQVVSDGGFTAAFDAVDDTISTVYFTGLGATGSTVFTVPDDGSASTAVDSAVAGLTAGFGVALSSDDTSFLYVADPAAETDTFGTAGNITATTLGQIVSYSLPLTAAAAAAPVSGTPGYAPTAVAVLAPASGTGSDTLYFTGIDPANGKGGLFSVSASGGTVSTIAEGSPFVNPSGLIVVPGTTTTGIAYVTDVGQVLSVNLP